MSVSRTRSKRTKVTAGFYSEETLRTTHHMSQSLAYEVCFFESPLFDQRQTCIWHTYIVSNTEKINGLILFLVYV